MVSDYEVDVAVFQESDHKLFPNHSVLNEIHARLEVSNAREYMGKSRARCQSTSLCCVCWNSGGASEMMSAHGCASRLVLLGIRSDPVHGNHNAAALEIGCSVVQTAACLRGCLLFVACW